MKKLVTMLMVSSLLFILGFGDVSRAAASANEMPSEAFLQSEAPLVDSEELINNLADTASAFTLVEMYAQNATIQTQEMFEKLEEISTELDLVQPLETHLEDINKNAKRWLGDLKPQLKQTTQDIITFTNTFETFTDPLRQAIEEGSQEEFLWGIQYLEDQVDKYETRTQILTEDLRSYRDDLEEIVGNLFLDSHNIQTYLEGEDGTLAALKDELIALEEELAQINSEISDLSSVTDLPFTVKIILATNLPTFITFVILDVADLSLKQQQKKIVSAINDKTKNLAQLETEYAALSHINSRIETTSDLAMDALKSTQSLQQSWITMKLKFVTLRAQVDNLDWELPQLFLLAMIDSTEEEAQVINEYAKNLQLDYEVIIEEPEE